MSDEECGCHASFLMINARFGDVHGVVRFTDCHGVTTDLQVPPGYVQPIRVDVGDVVTVRRVSDVLVEVTDAPEEVEDEQGV